MSRPTKYKPEYCEILIQHMKDGYSFESFAGKVEVFKDALYRWLEKYPEFSNAKKIGDSLGRYKMEKIGLDGMTGQLPGFNLGAWCFWMKNCYGWRDRHDITTNDEDLKVIVNVA